MSRTGRGNVQHEAARVRGAIENMPSRVSEAINMVKDANESLQEAAAPKTVTNDIKNLLMFGRLKEELSFGPYNFTISTLTNKQQKNIFKKLLPLTNEEKFANVKVFTLIEAIESINGSPIDFFYEGEQLDSVEEMKESVITEMQASLIDKIFEKYEDLVKKSNSIFEAEGGLGESAKN